MPRFGIPSDLDEDIYDRETTPTPSTSHAQPSALDPLSQIVELIRRNQEQTIQMDQRYNALLSHVAQLSQRQQDAPRPLPEFKPPSVEPPKFSGDTRKSLHTRRRPKSNDTYTQRRKRLPCSDFWATAKRPQKLVKKIMCHGFLRVLLGTPKPCGCVSHK